MEIPKSNSIIRAFTKNVKDNIQNCLKYEICIHNSFQKAVIMFLQCGLRGDMSRNQTKAPHQNPQGGLRGTRATELGPTTIQKISLPEKSMADLLSLSF